MIRAHKITLKPNNKQKTYFAKASGSARFAYNWALATWKTDYKAGLKPNEVALRRKLNAIKKQEFPWMSEVTKCAPQMAIKDLGKAFHNFFAKRAAYPTFKKKGIHDSFTLSNDHFRIEGQKIRIPHLGFVRMREELRFSGKILWATISRSADEWCVSISVEIADPLPTRKPVNEAVGIDLGINRLATLSTGEVFANPNALEKKLSQLRRLSKSLSRKKLGSRNRSKAKQKLAKLHKRISNLRSDYLHKFTSSVSRRYTCIGLEDLNVKGMTRNKHLSRRLSDSSFGEIRRQFEYKVKAEGGRVLFVDRFFASSKLCHVCKTKNQDLKLGDRQWQCTVCQTRHDRDENAAINIREAVSYTVAASTAEPVEKGALVLTADNAVKTKLSSEKQESNTRALH